MGLGSAYKELESQGIWGHQGSSYGTLLWKYELPILAI